MKKSSKALAATLLASTIFSSAITPTFAEEAKIPAPEAPVMADKPAGTGSTSSVFQDVRMGTELFEAVDYLSGLFYGIEPHQFGVDQSIKRVDAALIAAKFLDLNGVDNSNPPKASFKDVPARAVSAVSALKAAGIMNGKSDTDFGSQLNITRGEAAILFARIYAALQADGEGYPAETSRKFTDVTGRYAEPVALLTELGVVKGISETKFGTSQPLTRGQFALLLYRLDRAL
ncbi:S-layer homology domain-containing protein [Domibacillus robiginosus]|uniref:S-layer homology domain-containing protein n=1 Tax=Domibacillus robiginosus TaxID=1071054 RepID=UPI00067AFFD8|nr:S-layer homology domain-containing protein [Domibacillus robiginosus]